MERYYIEQFLVQVGQIQGQVLEIRRSQVNS